jgi:hypothetical protein
VGKLLHRHALSIVVYLRSFIRATTEGSAAASVHSRWPSAPEGFRMAMWTRRCG